MENCYGLVNEPTEVREVALHWLLNLNRSVTATVNVSVGLIGRRMLTVAYTGFSGLGGGVNAYA